VKKKQANPWNKSKWGKRSHLCFGKRKKPRHKKGGARKGFEEKLGGVREGGEEGARKK